MKSLSRRQKQVVKYFQEFSKEHGHRPAIREAAQALGYASPSSIVGVLNRAKALGISVGEGEGERGRRLRDPAVNALQTCITALDGCSPEDRRNNLAYLISKFGQP